MPKRRESPLSKPAGEGKTLRRAILETGADLIQDTAPLTDFDVYMVGFHAAKMDPFMQMEAHHYCKQVNEDFIQCVIFDGNTREANLIGIEYIVSERLFDDLPQQEKEYWHPHNYEVLSGTLVAPDLPDVAEKAFLRMLMNSYGKTWHTWHSGRHDGKGKPADPLPYGDPRLMWSFNRNRELDVDLLANRDDAMDIDTFEKRRARQELVEAANPQRGVDALKSAFPESEPIPGVVDAESAGDAEN